MKLDALARAVRIAAAMSLLAGPVVAQEGSDDARPVPAAYRAAGDLAGLAPDSLAFREALIAETAALPEMTRAAIDGFYASRDYLAFWTAGAGAALVALEAAVATAEAQGLPAARYDLAALEPPSDLREGAAAVPVEVAATLTFLKYAGDVSAGITRPLDIDPEINVRPERPSAAELLARLSDAPAGAVLDRAPPQAPEYRALMQEKTRLESLLGEAAWGDPVPAGPSLHRGETGPRIAAMRIRLARLGYGAAIPATPADPEATATPEAGAAPAVSPARFDPGLQQALEAFQRDSGLKDDGVAGPRTLAALNASVEDRLAQVLVNLERLRWLNRDLGARRIEVNIPAYSARMIDDGEVVWSSRTVVGEAQKTRTPEFSEKMTHMVVNPTWHIPDSIATRVYLPQLRSDPTVLARSNMRLFTRSGVEINPKLVNFNQYSAENFPFRVKQNPSAANALGRVKFMFPNQFSIYLHDTPAREYFSRDDRALSNGCIRLEEPLALADTLLEGQVDDPRSAFDGWLAAKKERYVYLDRPVQVHLMYRTAWAEPDGTIRYREDVYGRDAEVFAALAARGVKRPAAERG